MNKNTIYSDILEELTNPDTGFREVELNLTNESIIIEQEPDYSCVKSRFAFHLQFRSNHVHYRLISYSDYYDENDLRGYLPKINDIVSKYLPDGYTISASFARMNIGKNGVISTLKKTRLRPIVI
jgi:hypothetical protein